MDFAETEDQQMIREMVREFAETVAGPTCEKRDKEQIAPIKEFKKFAELGFAGMTIPEQKKKKKLDDISEAIVIEELFPPTTFVKISLFSSFDKFNQPF